MPGLSGSRRLGWIAAIGAVAVLVVVSALVLGEPPIGRQPGVALNSPASPPPADDLVPIEGATLIEERRFVHLMFIGGPPFSIFDPCSKDYGGWTHVVDGQLELAVYHVEPEWRLQLGPSVCHMIGYTREIALELSEPFQGFTARDIHSGKTFLITRPEGLYEIAVPDGWLLHWDEDFPSHLAPQWRRTHLRTAELGSSGLPGRLDFYQAL
jgi:hypothetical protein